MYSLYALIPNKDTLFALAAVQRKLCTAFSEHFAPALAACPTYPLWAFTNTPLPHGISSCRILSPRFLQSSGELVFPVELALSPAAAVSAAQAVSPPHQIPPPTCAAPPPEPCLHTTASLDLRRIPSHISQDCAQGRLALSIVASRVLTASTGWGFAHNLQLAWQPDECEHFPRDERVFRTAQVELEGALWRLSGAKWQRMR